jgi:putative RecB family exonuclease
MNTFSHSRVQKFIDCPAVFYRKYVLKLPEDSSLAATLGKAEHAIISAVGKAGSLDYAGPAIDAVYNTLDLKKDIKKDFKKDLERFIKNEFVLRAIKNGGTFEEHFEIPLDEFPLSPNVQGYIDYSKDEGSYITLIDWKTGFKEYHPLESYQMGLYAYYLTQKYEKPVLGRLVFLRSGRVTEHFYSEEDIEAARLWCLENASEIQKRLIELDNNKPFTVFPPQPGHLCKYCTWSAECKNEATPVVPETMEQAQELAAKILQVEASLGTMKDHLKTFITANGPVPVDDKQFYFKKSVNWRWNKDALQKAYQDLEQSGKDPFDVFGITAAKLKKTSWDEKQLLEFGAKKSLSKRFTFGKV